MRVEIVCLKSIYLFNISIRNDLSIYIYIFTEVNQEKEYRWDEVRKRIQCLWKLAWLLPIL